MTLRLGFVALAVVAAAPIFLFDLHGPWLSPFAGLATLFLGISAELPRRRGTGELTPRDMYGALGTDADWL